MNRVTFYILVAAVTAITVYVWGLKRKLKNDRVKVITYFRNKYNQQMGELISQFRQERVAIIHRFEGVIAELEAEVNKLEYKNDSNKTVLIQATTNMEIAESEESA